LLRAGLLEHLERMSKAAHAAADALVLSTGAREMILPGGMSESFQVLAQKRSTA
jgi:SAM-dependent MidA family methyltransferase